MRQRCGASPTDVPGVEELARFWEEGQRVFWSAAAGCPVGDSVVEAPEPAAFDGFWTALATGAALPGQHESWRALIEAAARYRAVVLGAWGRVHAAFDIQRRAMIDPAGPPPDWRILRDGWFATAEAEFIDTLRSDAFLIAQRDVLRAVIQWRAGLSGLERARLSALRSGARLAVQLGLDRIRIATTPKDEVWREGRAVLSRYRPLGRQPTLGPLVICFGLIGRQTMTDLTPERSLVRNLLAAGVDVFVLDWGDAGPEDTRNGFAHYADGQLGRALAAVRQASGVARPVLFGICQGGVFAACHAALCGARHGAGPECGIGGLILAVTPIDFHADTQDADPAHGLLNVWVRSLEEADIGAMIDTSGNLSGELMGLVFNQLNPVRTIAKYVIELPEAARDSRTLATFLAMEAWLADRPDLPGALARDWLVGLYRRNELVAGRFRMRGEPVDLGRIDVPVLNIHAAADHIIPASCARALGRHVAPRLYRELSLPTGHIGVFVSARAQAVLAPAIIRRMRELGAA